MNFELAHKLFEYKEGELYWKVNRGSRAKAGSVAGWLDPDGYRQVRVSSQRYYVHRIIWLMLNGDWPHGLIDHIEGHKSNNNSENLRLATKSENAKNAKKRSNNSSGYTGVCWLKREKRWLAYFTSNGKQTVVGYFNNKEDAHKAVTQARLEAGFQKNHGR